MAGVSVADALNGPKGEELENVCVGLYLFLSDLDALYKDLNLGRRATVHSSLNTRM